MENNNIENFFSDELFFKSSAIITLLVEVDTKKILAANKAAETFYGYCQKDFEQLHFTDLEYNIPIDYFIKTRIINNAVNAWHKTKEGKRVMVAIQKQSVNTGVDSDCEIYMIHDISTIHELFSKKTDFVHQFSNLSDRQLSFYENIHEVLRFTRKAIDWEFGEVWMPSLDGRKTEKKMVDCDERYADEIQLALKKFDDSYLIEECYNNKCNVEEPFFCNNLKETTVSCRQNQNAVEAGFQSVLHIPIVKEKKIICHIFFYSFSEKKHNQLDIEIASTAGVFLGAEIAKHRVNLILEQFFKISQDKLLILGISSYYKRVNKSFETFTGYTEEDFDYKNILQYIYPDDRKEVQEKLSDLQRNKSISYCESRIITKEGKVKWISWGAVKFKPEDIVFISFRDITKQKETLLQLEFSNTRYDLVSKATNEAIWDMDFKTKTILWSEGYKRLFGHKFSLDANDNGWETNIHPEEREKVIASFNNFIKQNNTSLWHYEYRFRRSDGTYANVIDKSYLIFDSNGSPLRAVGSMQDISLQKKLEKELLDNEKNKQIEITRAVLKAQEKERTEIANELHDNVCQLISTLKLYFQILDTKAENAEEIIKQGIDISRKAISDVRLLSRTLTTPKISQSGLVASIHDLIETYHNLQNFSVQFYPEEDINITLKEETQVAFYRILQECMSNMIKYANATEVSIELFTNETNLVMTIKDNGKGFELSTVKKGLGLQNIMNRAFTIGGHVEIITEPMKGCKIVVTIPKSQC